MSARDAWRKYGWIAKYPLLLIRMNYLKLRYINLPEEDYLVYQDHFYSGNSCLVSNDTDKFHKYRARISANAHDAGRNRSVLEVGGGAGFQTAALVAEGFEQVTSTDLSPERIHHARSCNKNPVVDYAVANVSELPFEDKSFDALVAVAMLHSMPNTIKRRSILEIARVTRHTIVIFEPAVLERPGLKRWFFAMLTQFFDESQYVKDFVRDPYDHILLEHGFELVGCEKGFGNFVETKTYQHSS